VRCALAARLLEAASSGHGYRTSLACLTRYNAPFIAACDTCADTRSLMCRADRLAIHWDCVLALPCRVEYARPSALGNEVSCTVDVALGTSFCGAYIPLSPPAPPSETSFSSRVSLTCHSWRTIPDYCSLGHDTPCVSCLLFSLSIRFLCLSPHDFIIWSSCSELTRNNLGLCGFCLVVLPRLPCLALRSPGVVLHHTPLLRSRLRVVLYRAIRDGAHVPPLAPRPAGAAPSCAIDVIFYANVPGPPPVLRLCGRNARRSVQR
jgi:hypothetical protein